MSECKVNEQNKKLPDSEKVIEISYPTPPIEHAEDTKLDNVKTRSVEKYPPNGMTHISPDANGLICQKKESCQEIVTKNVANEMTAVQGDCNSLDNDGHRCECDISVNEDINHISTNLQSVTLVDNEPEGRDLLNGIEYVVYESELQMPDIMRLITKDLSEPYSIYTYRYFIHNWPKLCFLAMDAEKCVGAVVCKLDLHKKMVRRGYIAMLAVDSEYRRRQIGSHLVLKAIKAMIADDCDEVTVTDSYKYNCLKKMQSHMLVLVFPRNDGKVVLETEITNQAALRLYENLGFVRDKRLFRYYLNGVDALRLKLWLR